MTIQEDPRNPDHIVAYDFVVRDEPIKSQGEHHLGMRRNKPIYDVSSENVNQFSTEPYSKQSVIDVYNHNN